MSDALAPDLGSRAGVVRLLDYNTHVGLVIRSGGVRWLLRTFTPDLVTLQEVQSPAARAWARALFNPFTWSAVGLWPASDGRGDTGTLVFARRTLFRKLEHRNPLISPFRDQDHPERSGTAGVFEHRPSGLVLDVGSVHTWALGAGATPAVRAGHRLQVEAYQRSAQRARELDRLPVRAGDWNEDIDGDGTSLAERAMLAADLEAARSRDDHSTRLDEVFVPSEIDTRNYRTVTMTGRGFRGAEGHHKAVVVDLILPTGKAAA